MVACSTRTDAVIAAGGVGSRMGADIPSVCMREWFALNLAYIQIAEPATNLMIISRNPHVDLFEDGEC